MDGWTPQAFLDLCETYHHDPLIVWASPNFLSQVKKSGVVNDPIYPENQWHLEKIQAAGAWDITTGSRDIVVAVMDDGVDIDHVDLRDNFPAGDSDHSDNGYTNDYYGWDFLNDDNDPNPSQEQDNHGTNVAGVIGATGNNQTGILGCAYNCTLMALKVVDGENWGSGAQMAQAILYAAGFHEDGIRRWRGADVINISLEFSPTWEVNDALHRAVTQGRGGKGCLIFCSSSNDIPGWEPWSITGFLSATYTFRWEYLKASRESSDQGTVWLDNITFPGGDMERFEAGMPADWKTAGDAHWICVQDGLEGNHAVTGWDGQYSKALRAGPVDVNAALSYGLIVVHDNRVYAASDRDHRKPYLGTQAALAYSQIVYADGSFSVRRRDGRSMDDHPVVAVSWFGAKAFCDYYGLRLPSEGQWRAVADYDGSYAYGCGTSIDQSRANYYDQDYANPLGLTDEPYTSPVGHYGAYGYGLCDMAGNVWEWTGTLSSDGYRFICGGSWWDSDCTVLGRYHNSPYGLYHNTGFRVCR